jgi:hypothetical protein
MVAFSSVANMAISQEAEPSAGDNSGQLQTVASVALGGYDNLKGDIGFLGQLGGRPESAQMLEGMLALFTQGKGLQGLDKSKPIGLLIQTDGFQVHPIGCVPITDLSGLLSIAQGFQATVTDNSDGTKTLTTADGKSLFIKESGNWAFVAAMPHSLVTLPNDPEATLRGVLGEYDVAVQVSFNKIPEMFRQMAIQGIRNGMEEGLQREADESDEQYEARKKLAQAQVDNFEQLLEEVDRFTLGLAIDENDQRLYFDAIYTALPGTKLADQMAGYRDAKTNFAGFAQPDAAMMLTFASKIAPAEIDQAKQMLTAARQQIASEIDKDDDIPSEAARETIKAAANDFIDAVESTLAGGVIDGGAVVHMEPESLTFVAGGLVADPTKVESGLKKLASVAEENPEISGFTWNAFSHEGVNFHTLTAPVPDDKVEARQMFGEKLDVAIGIGKNSVYVAGGRGYMDAAKKAIDLSLAEPNKSVPPFEFSMSLAKVMTTAAAFAKPEDKAKVEAMAELLRTQAQGRDHLRMVGTAIPNGLRYRVEAEEGVLKAIGTSAANQQQAGAF